MTLLIVSGCVMPSTKVQVDYRWYCTEGYKPIGLTDAEAAALPGPKVDRIDGNDAVWVEKCKGGDNR